MKYNLFLDDERVPKDVSWVELPLVDWVIVRSYDEFVKTIIKAGVPSIVSFDHDLHPSHYEEGKKWNFNNFEYHKVDIRTGLHCALFLREHCKAKKIEFPKYYVHTMNRFGKEQINRCLEKKPNIGFEEDDKGNWVLTSNRLEIAVNGHVVLGASIGTDIYKTGDTKKLIEVLEEIIAVLKAPKTEDVSDPEVLGKYSPK
jgi:hypothetical protein